MVYSNRLSADELPNILCHMSREPSIERAVPDERRFSGVEHDGPGEEDMLPDILGHVSSREPSMERSPPIRRSEANSSAENVDALMVTTMLSHEASYMPSPHNAARPASRVPSASV